MRSTPAAPRRRAAAVLAAAVLGLTAAQPATAEPVVPSRSGTGITVSQWQRIGWERATDVRLYEATLSSPAIYRAELGSAQQPVRIKTRVLLPADYRTNTARRYDVLYLLHGGGGSANNWSVAGGLLDIVRRSSFDGIVVMPEGGIGGWYTNWSGPTDGRFRPDWETFHIDQLIPWVDATFHTNATRSGRGIAGVSMGGFGALKYAGTHNDLFSVVGSFSGGTNLHDDWAQEIVAASGWQAGAAISGLNFFDPRARVNLYRPDGVIEFDQALQRAHRLRTILGPVEGWARFNPLDLAIAGEYDTFDGKLALYAGGTPAWGVLPSVEHDIARSNRVFHHALTTRGVSHRYCTGPGTHTWDYFSNDLKDFLEYAYGTPPETCTTNPGWTAP